MGASSNVASDAIFFPVLYSLYEQFVAEAGSVVKQGRESAPSMVAAVREYEAPVVLMSIGVSNQRVEKKRVDPPLSPVGFKADLFIEAQSPHQCRVVNNVVASALFPVERRKELLQELSSPYEQLLAILVEPLDQGAGVASKRIEGGESGRHL